MPEERRPVLVSRTLWGALAGALAAMLAYASQQWGVGEDPDWRIALAIAAGSLASTLGAIGGRWRGGPRLTLRRPGRRMPGVTVLCCVGVPLVCGGCAGRLDALGAIGSAAVVGQAAFDCADVDVDVQVPSSAADVLTVQHALRAMADLALGRDAQYESDLVRVVLQGCGRRFEVFLAAGVATGRAVVGLPSPDQ